MRLGFLCGAIALSFGTASRAGQTEAGVIPPSSVEPAASEAPATTGAESPAVTEAPAAEGDLPAGEADLSPLETLLEESVVSTASLSSETTGTAPGTVWTIGAEELRRFGMTTLAEALSFLSLGMHAEAALDYYEVGSRGVVLTGDYSGHILMLIDGHAVNEQWDSATYWGRAAGIPLEVVDHIEIVLGPGSVLYGSSAMLGVVNVITKRAKDFVGLHAVAESELPSSVRAGAGFGQEFTLAGRAGEVVGALEYYASRGPAVKVGPQDYGADAATGDLRCFTRNGPCTGIWGGTIEDGRYSRIPSGYLRATWGDLALDLRAVDAVRGTPDTIYNNFDDPKGYERDRWLSGDMSYRLQLGAAVGVQARLYGDAYRYYQQLPTTAAENCLGGQDQGCKYRLSGDARWSGLEVQLRTDWSKDGRWVTLVGADGRVRRVWSEEDYVDNVTREAVLTDEYRHTERALGAYLEQTARPWTWLSLNLGARLDYDERFGSHLSPRAAVRAEAWSGGSLKLVYAEAFRAPNAYETYFSDPTWWLAAEDLDPETVRSVELAFEQRLGVHRVVVGVFATRWQDLVASEDLTDDEIAAAQAAGELEAGVTSAGKYRNVAEIESFGGNLAYEGASLGRRLRYGLSLTAGRAREDYHDGEEPAALPVAPEIFGNARVSYDLGERLPTLALVGRFVGKRLVDSSDFDPLPEAPAQVELRATVSGAIPFLPSLAYRLTGHYAFADESPYSIGPLSEPTGDYVRQETTPVDRYRVILGLWWDLPL